LRLSLPAAMYYTQIHFVCLLNFNLAYSFDFLATKPHYFGLSLPSTLFSSRFSFEWPIAKLSFRPLVKFQIHLSHTNACGKMENGREVYHQTNYKPVWANCSIIKFLLIEENLCNWWSLHAFVIYIFCQLGWKNTFNWLFRFK